MAPAPTSAYKCLVAGEGKTTARPGRNTFTIVARDQFGEDRGTGGDQFEIAVAGPGTSAVPIVDTNDGTYAATITPISIVYGCPRCRLVPGELRGGRGVG